MSISSAHSKRKRVLEWEEVIGELSIDIDKKSVIAEFVSLGQSVSLFRESNEYLQKTLCETAGISGCEREVVKVINEVSMVWECGESLVTGMQPL